MEYTVQYFINKFSAIPEELWHIRQLTNPANPNQHCALGHCEIKIPVNERGYLTNLFNAFNRVVEHINDGDDFRYEQPTPKQRILAALHDIRRMQEEAKVVEPIKRERVKIDVPSELLEIESGDEIEKPKQKSKVS